MTTAEHRATGGIMTAVRPLSLIACLAFALSPAAAEQFATVGTFGGAFARIPVDARGEAMGLATTVDPIGPTAFWWNPAPLPEGDRATVSYTIRDYAADLRWRPLAFRASRGNLTFGYLWGRLSLDPMLVRTAYEPDGDGRTLDASANLHQFSGAADLAPWLAGGPTAWVWTIGANARYHHQRLAETTMATWDADFGTSLAWTAIDDAAIRLRLYGAAMVRNLLAGRRPPPTLAGTRAMRTAALRCGMRPTHGAAQAHAAAPFLEGACMPRDFARSRNDDDMRSEMAAPILHGEDVVGCLSAAARRPAAFDDDDRDFLRQVGRMTGDLVAERRQAL